MKHHVGDQVLAVYEDHWYRATVTEVFESPLRYKVTFIDDGIVLQVPAMDVKLPDETTFSQSVRLDARCQISPSLPKRAQSRRFKVRTPS